MAKSPSTNLAHHDQKLQKFEDDIEAWAIKYPFDRSHLVKAEMDFIIRIEDYLPPEAQQYIARIKAKLREESKVKIEP